MKFKDLRLDAVALFSQVVYGHGFLHYGFWPEGKPQDISLENLGKAQQRYFEKLFETLPSGISSILDVGSGTGSNAAELLKKGFTVDCVCPSSKLNELARKKLPESTQIFEGKFEEFSTDKSYDTLIFCESFHYIDNDRALSLASQYAEKYVIIFDYFRREDGKDKDRISHKQFRSLLSEKHSSVFDVVKDDDVTDYITPTFMVLDEINNTYVKPFISQFISDFRTEHPFYSFIFSRPLKKLGKNAQKASNRYQKFSGQHEYRLILLKKI